MKEIDLWDNRKHTNLRIIGIPEGVEKDKENLPKVANDETDLYSLIDIKFKRETAKILKELRENMKELRVDINSDADSF